MRTTPTLTAYRIGCALRNHRVTAAVLRTASGAAVRESTRAGRVGADGELLYRYPGYRPDADRFDVRPLPNVLVGVLCGVGTSTLVMLALFALVAWVESRR